MEPNNSTKLILEQLSKAIQNQTQLSKAIQSQTQFLNPYQAQGSNDVTSFNSILHQMGYTPVGGSTSSTSTTTYEDSFYPDGKIFDRLTPSSSDTYLWHSNLAGSLDDLNAKLGSPRLRNIKPLWYSGYEYRDLKKLERSLVANRDVVDDVNEMGIDFAKWKFWYRKLKDLLCEIDDLLDAIAMHVPQLNQLFQFDKQHQGHPSVIGIVIQIGQLTSRLDDMSREIRTQVLQEIVHEAEPPLPKPSGYQSPHPSDMEGGRQDQISMFYALPNQFSVDDIMNMSMGSRKKSNQILTDDIGNFKGIEKMKSKADPVRDDVKAKSMGRKHDPVRDDTSHDLDATETNRRYPDQIRDDQTVENTRNQVLGHDEEIPPTYHISEVKEKNPSLDCLPEHLKRCFLYTSLFPRSYRFEKDTLVHLWIAAGFIRQERRRLIEDIGGGYFDELLSMSFFQEAPLDYSHDKLNYKVKNDIYTHVQERLPGEYARLEDGNLDTISKETLHSSVLCEIVDPMIFRSFRRLNGLHSLLLLHDSRKSIKQIPYDLFLNMMCLSVLDLSLTQIKELPSSIGNVEALCYLDLSQTSIKRLPESVSNLLNLQILKLRDCFAFTELPKDMNSMTNLRHLDLDIIRQLTFMSPRMGSLTSLQTLGAYIVGKESGYQIAELKYLHNLRESLTIVKLENVVSAKEAEEAALNNKQYLRKLDLQWSRSCLGAGEVLEGLVPHTNIEELEIVCYGGLKFPRWFGDSSYSKLSSIYLYNCKNCVILPPLGRLPNLKTLHIREMHKVKEINHQFSGGGRSTGFPSLEILDFDGFVYLENWVGLEEGDMPRLRRLTIVDCPKLVELPMLSNLESLQYMEISLCSELPQLAEERLPSSLQELVIAGCPILKEQCLKEGDEWEKIADIPNVWIDHHKISTN